jgi:hypothetical protein
MVPSGLESNKKMAYAEYDFALDGGAIGDITLRGSVLPAGAFIVGGWVDIVTALTSGGAATAALKTVAAGDLLPATGKASFEASGKIGLATFINGGMLVGPTTTATPIKLTVAAAALTAGKFVVAAEYIVTR